MSKQSKQTSIHPGEILRDELLAKQIKQIDFAATIGVPSPVLNDLLNGKRNFTPEIAVLLETALGIDAGTWLRLQAERDIEVARTKAPLIQKQKDIEIWREIQACCNTSYLNRALPGGLGDSLAKKIEHVLQFFSVPDVKSLKNMFVEDVDPSYFRKSRKLADIPSDIFTWKHIAFYKSSLLDDCPYQFNANCHKDVISGLNTILYENEDTKNRITCLLRENGIKFQIVENEKGTHIDGFSFWQGKNPTITLTLRYHKLDILAFTLLHEFAHILYHMNESEKEKCFLTLPDEKDTLLEQEADAFAQKALIPETEWQLFKIRHAGVSPYAINTAIRDFARTHQIHPAIVLGRYQHDTKIYDNGRGIERAIN